MDVEAEIKKLYYSTTKATIARDLARAVTLLKTLPDEEARERVAVYMPGPPPYGTSSTVRCLSSA